MKPMVAMRNTRRDCPICGGVSDRRAFPYSTRFNHLEYAYLHCASCATVFVDPLPDASTFGLMYAKATYHDCHYGSIDDTAYTESIGFLSRRLPPGRRVLDYGCGSGYFLRACVAHGYAAVGVEFDVDEARAAGDSTGCRVYSVSEFHGVYEDGMFDAIHLGDVLEHLPDPLGSMSLLVDKLPEGGVIFVEGPLEANPSLVYWVAVMFGSLKKLFRPDLVGSHPPTHLFLTSVDSQLKFFQRLGENVKLVEWEVGETGWPYSRGGVLKRLIARLARQLGGRQLFGVVFGNRFKAVLIKMKNA